MTSISKISIRGFRGVSRSLSLTLCDAQGEAQSLLLSGDNGCGKSTVVDALEFGLCGHIHGDVTLARSSLPSALSLFDASSSEVSIALSTGETVVRSVRVGSDGSAVFDPTPNPAFRMLPLVVRRKDILEFWDTPDEHKQVVFLPYFQVAHADIPSAGKLNELKARALRLRKLRRQTWDELAQQLGAAAIASSKGTIPVEQWLTDHLFGGESRRARIDRGERVTLPPRQYELMKRLREQSKELTTVNREVAKFENVMKSLESAALAKETTRRLHEASRLISEAFMRLSPAGPFVESITIEVGRLTAVSMAISIRLKNGATTMPRKILSEANLDLLALLMYMAIAIQAADQGQAKVFVLDDVFQSFDGETRLRTVEFMLREMKDWQFVVTAHDRLWREQLRNVFRRNNVPLLEVEITKWEFSTGPEIRAVTESLDEGLKSALNCGEVYQVCAEAGRLLERVSGLLSFAIPISVTRRKDDKYTLGDLWPGVLKAIKKTSAAEEALEVDRWVNLRNLSGAHYNESASALSRSEARAFGESVLRLCDKVWCTDCARLVEWIRSSTNYVVEIRCRCRRKCLSGGGDSVTSASDM